MSIRRDIDAAFATRKPHRKPKPVRAGERMLASDWNRLVAYVIATREAKP